MTYYTKLSVAFLLLSESASLIRGYPVNTTNPCHMKAECEENMRKFINYANLYILNVFRDADEKYDWENIVAFDD